MFCTCRAGISSNGIWTARVGFKSGFGCVVREGSLSSLQRAQILFGGHQKRLRPRSVDGEDEPCNYTRYPSLVAIVLFSSTTVSKRKERRHRGLIPSASRKKRVRQRCEAVSSRAQLTVLQATSGVPQNNDKHPGPDVHNIATVLLLWHTHYSSPHTHHARLYSLQCRSTQARPSCCRPEPNPLHLRHSHSTSVYCARPT